MDRFFLIYILAMADMVLCLQIRMAGTFPSGNKIALYGHTIALATVGCLI